MTADTDWMDGDVLVPEEPPINTAQVFRLLRLNELMCNDEAMLETVLLIKQSISIGDEGYARQLWDDLSDDEQQTLWVAPTYGGIFTTRERKILRCKDD